MIELTNRDKITLLKLARVSIEMHLKKSEPGEPEYLSPGLSQNAGVFVTLHKQGQLRGCIGTFYADRPLYKQVIRMAKSSAFEDSRFPPVKSNELAHLDIEISVLSPRQQIDSIEDIIIGKHGIYVTRGFYRGVLLPQVATDHGWDRNTFLEHTCLKAGLPSDAWRNDTTIEIFSAEIFCEEDMSAET